jgi:uncharacterized protein
MKTHSIHSEFGFFAQRPLKLLAWLDSTIPGLLLVLLLSCASLAGADAKQVRVVSFGGGTHHDFETWFNKADTKTLQAEGFQVQYTEEPKVLAAQLKDATVLYLSNNQPIPGDELRGEILKFAESGRGMLLVHAALWYNWRDWPEYNRVLVGGGTRRHDRYGEFEVKVTAPKHPVMAGIPEKFRITDELYHFQKDAEGAEIEVLATAFSNETNQTYPIVWITRHPETRIVCITLGHDGAAHEHPVFKQLLINSVRWVAEVETRPEDVVVLE